MEQKVIYDDQVLTLTQLWVMGEPCLWTINSQRIGILKIEFVDGYPNGYCISLKNPTETELEQITSLDGTPPDMTEELRQHLAGKDKPYGAIG